MERRPILREHGDVLEIALHAVPRARATVLDGVHDGALKLRIVAPPVEGAANRAIVAFFADLLEIPRSRVSIASGARSRLKRLQVVGISAVEFRQRLPEAIRRALDADRKRA